MELPLATIPVHLGSWGDYEFWDKPWNWHTLPKSTFSDTRETEPCLASFLLNHQGPLSLGMEHDFGLCHRLDYGTSGLIMRAKTPTAWRAARELFQKKQISKLYLARTQSPFQDISKILHNDTRVRLGQSKKSARRVLLIRNSADEQQIRGRPHLTHTRLLSTFSDPRRPNFLDVAIAIETGFRHQIRVVASRAWGLPLLGDVHYGGMPAERCFLHSFGMTFSLEKKDVRFFCTPPEPWQTNEEWITSVQNSWLTSISSHCC